MPMKIKFILLSLLFVFVFASCSDDGIGDPVAHGRHFLEERTEEYMTHNCPVFPNIEKTGTYDCYSSDRDTCRNHTDCSDKPNGYCYTDDDPCECHYHECLEDSDCADDEACICYASREHRICAKSCRSSNECEEGHKCIEAGIWGGCLVNQELLGSQGFRCTSNEDECESDWDCPKDYRCVYTERKGHFSCEYNKWPKLCEGIDS